MDPNIIHLPIDATTLQLIYAVNRDANIATIELFRELTHNWTASFAETKRIAESFGFRFLPTPILGDTMKQFTVDVRLTFSANDLEGAVDLARVLTEELAYSQKLAKYDMRIIERSVREVPEMQCLPTEDDHAKVHG